MRISDLIRLGKSAFIFALVIAIAVLLIWFIRYKRVNKKMMKDGKNILF